MVTSFSFPSIHFPEVTRLEVSSEFLRIFFLWGLLEKPHRFVLFVYVLCSKQGILFHKPQTRSFLCSTVCSAHGSREPRAAARFSHTFLSEMWLTVDDFEFELSFTGRMRAHTHSASVNYEQTESIFSPPK